MSVFDPDLEYLVKKTDPYQYYLFSEVSQITDCKGTCIYGSPIVRVYKTQS